MNRATYACTGCGAEKILSERPWADGPVTIRTGCPECARITAHVHRQSFAYIDRLARRGRSA